MTLASPPVVQQQMLVRRPAAEVFEALIDPAITTRFWFTKSSGRLEPGKTVRWEWEMYGVSVPVVVEELEPPRRIRIGWGDPPTPVAWELDERADGTLVRVTASGFAGTDEEVVAQALDAMGGFSFHLAALKAFLEHGIELGLVADHNPDAHR